MKTLIVLTDFSKTAHNAANIALEIAIQLDSDLLLVNSYILPLAVFAAEAEGRSPLDSSLFASASEDELKKETKRLYKRLNRKVGMSRKPLINFLSTIDSVNQTLKTLDESLEIAIIIMGNHKSSLPTFFSAIDIDLLMESIACPLMVIPKNFKGFPIENFVFATDLDKNDLTLWQWIRANLGTFHFDIHVCHVSQPAFIPNFNEENKVMCFEHQVAMLGKKSISFTNLEGKNIARTINEFNDLVNADMMGLVYNQHSFLWKLFNETHIAKLFKNHQLPLLIFPPDFSQNINVESPNPDTKVC